MKLRNYFGIVMILLVGAISVNADVLELKNGSILNGKYVGGTAGTLRFETNTGLQVIQTSQILALTFTSSGGGTVTQPQPTVSQPQAVQTTTASAPVPSPQRTLTLPTGTMLVVRMMDSISSRNRAGSTFTTKLEYDLVVGDAVALKAGTKIYGKVKSATQARRAIGRSTLDIRLDRLIIGGKPIPITTKGFKAAGQASIAKAAKGAAAGALVGSIAGDSDDARKGAAIGATMGALSRGQTITIPPGALLEFNLAQPTKLTVGS
jgi:hypothetical protein